ncbi:shikimate dehydrogenase [Candidatus Bathyarchaeota archaeon A05DMB-2]|jgi:shikimate dehydrogenase|nr:shikimate dehydrogenase [Candidatus Bathyarchaeota archaeon A05DMB-2]
MTISGKTRVCGVIGDPIEHTLSPAIQNAAFTHLKLDFVFLAFRVKAVELEDAMRGMRGLGIHGLNVTMPHKKAVTAFLDEIDSTAKFLCAVNTVLNDNGRLCGFNTDGVGALKALQENGVDPSGKKVLLLGAGGAAKAIAFQLAKEAEELVLLNRTPEKATELAELLNQALGKEVKGAMLSPNTIQKNLRDSDLLVNATSVGMHPNDNQSPVAREWLKPDLTVMDIVYNPVETQLAKDAKAAGARVISGVEMLVHQGAASFEIWTGRPAPVEVMRKAAMWKLVEDVSR